MTNYHMRRVSTNVKTGPIPVSTTGRQSCPPSCPFMNNGCYAEAFPLRLHWDAVTEGERGGTLEQLTGEIRALPKGQLWRHNQAGDLPGIGDRLDGDALGVIVEANRGRRGFTYTHKPLDAPGELEAVKQANAAGFTVNLSANSLEHADKLKELDAGPVVTVVPVEYGRGENKQGWTESEQDYRERLASLPELKTPAGRPVVICPATRMDIDCARCGLCAVAGRRSIVAFPAHGNAKRKAEKAAAAFELA